MNSIFKKIIPFIFLGIMLVVLAFGIILFSYVLILGAIIGFVLYVIAIIREKLFSSKNLTKPSEPKRRGRIIEHDEYKDK